MMSLPLATSVTSVIVAKTPQPNPALSSTASSQDKAKACNNAGRQEGP
jgi:hypothetical protein